MKLSNRLLASSALIVWIAATPLNAANLRPSVQGFADQSSNLPVVSVQMSVSEARIRLEAAMAALAEAQANDGDVAAAKAEAAAAQAEVDAAMAAEAKTEAPAPEPAVEAPVEPAPVEEEPVAEPAPNAAKPVEKPTEPAPAEEQPAAEKPATETPVEEAPADETAPAEEAPAEPAPVEKAPAAEPAPVEEAPAEPAPAEEAPADATPTEKPANAEQPAADQPAAEQPSVEPAPAEKTPEEKVTPVEKPANVNQPAPASEPAPGEEKPAAEAAPVEQKTEAEQNAEAEASAKATAESQTEVTPEATLPVEGGAPVLDSAKEGDAAPGGEAKPKKDRKANAAPADAQPAPENDAAAQAEVIKSEDIPAPLAEEGQRLEAAPTRRERTPDEGKVVQETNNRFVIEFNNQIIVENNDRDRIRQRAENVYYEELPRGRTREVITRRNGVQIVTVRDRYGETIRRSKIMPDGREILLAYVPEDARDNRRPWYEAGSDLPPLYLTIPIGEYVLDATVARPGQFYEFLEQAPVERVERIYSVDEVKHSARIRDKVRRIDMDTLTFEFGSAQIPRDQVNSLADVADAMDKILSENPGETFLIEGHTDAVGSQQDNLILSDERAESVAIALSSVYGIPPENLATQGYGERYLKVRTEAAERLNRRVTIRRITPLVTPVASR